MKALEPDPSEPVAQALGGARVAVTGATGFIGRRLVRELLQVPDSRLTVLVRDTSNREGLDDPRITAVVAPLERPDLLAAALRGADFVFHLAGSTRARDRARYIRTNREGTIAVARAAAEAAPDLRRFVHVSSLAAVGPAPPGGVVDESTPPRPRTWYGESKLLSEQALEEALPPSKRTICRPPAVYGPGERDLFALFRSVSRGLAACVGSPRKSYSFVYVDDLAAVLLRLAAAPVAAGRTYFVAHPEVRTQGELLDGIAAALGRRPCRVRVPHAVVAVPCALGSLLQRFRTRPPLLTLQRLREITPDRWVCSAARLARDLELTCATDLARGLGTTAAWYRSRGWL